MFNCGKCSSKLSDGVLCASCSRHYDYQCAGVSETAYRKMGAERKASWRCTLCKAGPASSPSNQTPPPDTHSIMAAIEKLTIKLKPIDSLVASIQELRAELSDIKTSVETAHSWMKDLSDKVKNLEGRLVKVEKVSNEVSCLKQSITAIEHSLNDRDQRSRLCNVEIKGLPLSNNENLFEILKKIGSKAGVPVSNSDISFISRVQTRAKDAPKPIIGCFTNRYLKENFVSAVRSLKGLCATDLGYQDGSRIYVNDHLTPANKQLLSKAKAAAKENHYQFIWVKQCKIMLRKDTTSPILTLRSEEDLKKLR